MPPPDPVLSDFNQMAPHADLAGVVAPDATVRPKQSKLKPKRRESISKGSKGCADARPAQLADSEMLVIITTAFASRPR